MDNYKKIAEHASVAADLVVEFDDESYGVRDRWYADDGNAEICVTAKSGREAAEEYVAGGDWGAAQGSIDVLAWQVDYRLVDGELESEMTNRHSYSIDLPVRHMIEDQPGSCGTDPDDHEWEDDVDGVMGHSGTAISESSHCAVCNLRRVWYYAGSQRNPGEAAERVTYHGL